MDEDNIIDEQSASRHTPHGRSFVANTRRRAGGESRSGPARMRRDVDPVHREAAF
jgi:hypothetical protein